MRSNRWTALPPLELFGVGTALVESLEHYVQRQAWTTGHNPAEWFGRSEIGRTSFFCGPGTSFLSTVDRMQELTGRGDLYCGTLRNIAGLAAQGYLGLTSRLRRWCPACYMQWGDESYELLAWQMPHVFRCPVHDCLLEGFCRSCLAPQRHCRSYAKRRLCQKCGTTLGGEGRRTGESRYASWAASESLLLVERCADPNALSCERDACSIFAKEAAEGILYDLATPESVRHGVRRVVEGANGGQCDMDTLLNLCALQGVHLVDALDDPVGAASRPLPWMRATHSMKDFSCQSSAARLELLKQLVQRMLGEIRGGFLPSLWVLAHLVGVSLQHVRRHWDPVFDDYGKLMDREKILWQSDVDEWHVCAASLVSDLGIDPWDVFDAGWVAQEIAKRRAGDNFGIYAAIRSFQILRLRDDVTFPSEG